MWSFYSYENLESIFMEILVWVIILGNRICWTYLPQPLLKEEGSIFSPLLFEEGPGEVRPTTSNLKQ
jgi:hypothetical protein